MRSHIPSFQEPGSEEDDARWEAYRALLRRNARHPDAPDVEHEDPSWAFEPAEDEPLTIVPAKAAGSSDIVADEADAPVDELFLDRVRTPASPPRRSRRLVIGVMAVTAGLILAVALVPHQPSERVVVLRSPAQVSSGDQAAPPQVVPAEPLAEMATSQAAAPAAKSSPPERRAALDRQDRTPAVAAPAHRRAERPSATVPPDGKESLDCWLTAMNNGRAPGNSDGGLSTCGGPAPASARSSPPPDVP
jgi:hypothetical protein